MASPEAEEAAKEIARHLGIEETEDDLFEQVATGSRILSEEELDRLLQKIS